MHSATVEPSLGDHYSPRNESLTLGVRPLTCDDERVMLNDEHEQHLKPGDSVGDGLKGQIDIWSTVWQQSDYRKVD